MVGRKETNVYEKVTDRKRNKEQFRGTETTATNNKTRQDTVIKQSK